MGIDTYVKRFLRETYPRAFEIHDRNFKSKRTTTTTTTNETSSSSFPKAPVFILDATNRTKYVPRIFDPSLGEMRYARTGREFVDAHLMSDVTRAYAEGQAHSVYCCLDRGAPANKAYEHQKRLKGLTAMPDPPPTAPPLVSNTSLPDESKWKEFLANPRARMDLLAYVTHTFLDDHVTRLKETDEDYKSGTMPKAERKRRRERARALTFLPPPNGTFYLHGGCLTDRLQTPCSETGRPILPPTLYYVENALCTENDTNSHEESTPSVLLPLQQQPRMSYRRLVGEVSPPRVTPERIERLLEGEFACLHYATLHPDEDCCFISADGDMLLQLLMMAADRIDPATNTFRNKHTLILRVPQDADVVVDINTLYQDIAFEKLFLQAGITEPVLTLCALATLSKNDYIHGYCPGIKTFRIKNTDTYVPFPLHVLYSQPMLAAGLIRIALDTTLVNGLRNDARQPLDVRLDEERFLTFTQELYLMKYRDLIAKRWGRHPSKITALDVKTFLADKSRSAKNRMMPKALMRVYARQLSWVMHYWMNGYRGECIVESPLAMYAGLPYYGWTRSPTKGCEMVERVSVARERPEVLFRMTVIQDHHHHHANNDPTDDHHDEDQKPDSESTTTSITADVRAYLKRRRSEEAKDFSRQRKRLRHSLHHSSSLSGRNLVEWLNHDVPILPLTMTPPARALPSSSTSPSSPIPPPTPSPILISNIDQEDPYFSYSPFEDFIEDVDENGGPGGSNAGDYDRDDHHTMIVDEIED